MIIAMILELYLVTIIVISQDIATWNVWMMGSGQHGAFFREWSQTYMGVLNGYVLYDLMTNYGIFERLRMPTNICFPEELGVPKFDGWPGVWPMCFPSANFFGIAFGVLLWHILAINVAMKMWPEIWGTWPIFHIFVTVPRNEAGLSCYRPIHWPMMRRGFWCLFLSSITSWIFQWYILIWLGDETWWNIHNYKLFWCSPKRDHFHSCPSYCSYCSCFISKMWWLWWRVKKRYLGFGGTHFG